MNKHVLFICVICFAGCTSEVKYNSYEGAIHEFGIETIAEFSSFDSDNDNAVIGEISHVLADSKGAIYIADRMAMNIKVFNIEGDLLNVIGARGRGPGEFLDLTAVTLDEQDNLIVADQMNFMITKFSSSGNIISTWDINPNTILWPRWMKAYTDNRFIFAYLMPDAPLSSSFIFHEFEYGKNSDAGDSFSLVNEFGDFYALDFADNLFTRLHAMFIIGSASAGASEIFYSPGLYNGKIWRFAKKNSSWVLNDVIQGYSTQSKPFEVVERPYPEHAFSVSGRERAGAIIHSESLGLFHLQDGKMVHFSLQAKDEAMMVFAEIFDENNALVKVGFIPELSHFDQRYKNSPLRVAWKDEKDQFYVLNNSYSKTFQLKIISLGLD